MKIGQTSARIDAAVSVMLTGPAFQRSELNRDLLLYIAAEMRAGRGADINEYTIAQDIFDRGHAFDPASDPIVRVRMRRLRKAITLHNADQPAGTDLIELPAAQYQLALVPRTPAHLQSRPNEARGIGLFVALPAAAATLMFAIITVTFDAEAPRTGVQVLGAQVSSIPVSNISVSGGPQGEQTPPEVHVELFRNLTGNADNDVFEARFQNKFAADLKRMGYVKAHTKDTHQSAPQMQDDLILQGNILSLSPQVDVVVRLIDASSNTRIFEQRFSWAAGHPPHADGLATLASKVSEKLGKAAPASR